MEEVPYRCPICVGPLDEREAGFGCPACRREYRRGRFGIPDFTVLPEEHREAHERWERVIAAFIPWRTRYLRRKRIRRLIDALLFRGSRGLKEDDYDRYTWERLVEHVGVRGTVLEVGCGPGSLYDVARWDRYVGVDPVVYLRRRPPFQFCRAYGEFLPFPDATFDAVYMAASFDYLFSPETALRRIRRVLKPTGAFGLALGVGRTDGPGTLQIRLYSLQGLLAVVEPHFCVEYRVEEPGYVFVKGRPAPSTSSRA